MNKYFIQQDRWAVERVDTSSEKLRGNDIVALGWRKLAARARGAYSKKGQQCETVQNTSTASATDGKLGTRENESEMSPSSRS